MSPELIFSPSEFVAVLNQTLEFAYPSVVIEGELSEFRVSKNSWVYFKLKDDSASVQFFGTVYKLPGPLEDGISVRVVGAPRLHAKFGFSVNFNSIAPVGEGSIKKAADLLRAKLEAEGLFAFTRKRLLPYAPARVGLITSANSAACADFIRVLNDRWGGVEVQLVDSLVQGNNAPTQIVKAIEHFNQMADLPEVLAIVRGGGGAEDLAAFNDERVVRAVAASRAPTLVAIGHEVDESLAELAADARASTPTAAATRLFPDRQEVMASWAAEAKSLKRAVHHLLESELAELKQAHKLILNRAKDLVTAQKVNLESTKRIIEALSPAAVLGRGYALLKDNQGKFITSAHSLKPGQPLTAELRDGTIGLRVKDV